jgi:hypothetical protein
MEICLPFVADHDTEPDCYVLVHGGISLQVVLPTTLTHYLD